MGRLRFDQHRNGVRFYSQKTLNHSLRHGASENLGTGQWSGKEAVLAICCACPFDKRVTLRAYY